MAVIIYSLCVFSATLCAWLLLRAYGRSGYRLLLWGGLCFVGLTMGNTLLIVDKLILPTQVDLTIMRHSVTIASLIVLLYGLIWDAE